MIIPLSKIKSLNISPKFSYDQNAFGHNLQEIKNLDRWTNKLQTTKSLFSYNINLLKTL